VFVVMFVPLIGGTTVVMFHVVCSDDQTNIHEPICNEPICNEPICNAIMYLEHCEFVAPPLMAVPLTKA